MASFPPPKTPTTAQIAAAKEQIRQWGADPSGIGDVNVALTTASGASREKDLAVMPVKEENYRSLPTNIVDSGSRMKMPTSLLSPHIQMGDAPDSHNKKARRTCVYHSRGWCIRGASCHFYHDEALGTPNRKASSSEVIPPGQSDDSHNFGGQNEMIDPHKYGELGRTPSRFGKSSQHNSHMDSFRTGNLGIQSGRHTSVSLALPQGVPTGSYSKIPSGDWEPSVPFQPSHVITRTLLVKENINRPLNASGHQTIFDDGPSKFSGSDNSLSVKNVQKLGNTLQEGGASGSVHTENIMKDNILSFTSNKKVVHDQVGLRSYPSADLFSEKDASAFNFTIDNLVKLPDKYFEEVLIKYVKYLLEPAWEKGLVSKDNFKMIVKKSVDKVIKSFHPHGLPGSYDSIKSYIFTSQTKIGNLVLAYFKKYGRSRN